MFLNRVVMAKNNTKRLIQDEKLSSEYITQLNQLEKEVDNEISLNR